MISRPLGPVPKLESASESKKQTNPTRAPSHQLNEAQARPEASPPTASSSWRNTRTLLGHESAVLCLQLNASGTHILTGGHDRTVRLWNPRKPENSEACLAIFRDGRISHPVADIAIMPGSRQFATCGGNTQALLWDVKTKQLVRKMSGHSLRINCVTEGAGGSVLVTGGYDRSVSIHDMRSRSTIQTLEHCCRDSVEYVCVVGKEIIAASADGHVYVFDVAAGKIRIHGYHAPIGFMCSSLDGRTLLLSCQNGAGLQLTERATGLVLGQYCGAHKTTDFKIGCAFLDHGRKVCTGSESGEIVIYDSVTESAVDQLVPPDMAQRQHLPPEYVAVTSLSSSRDYGFLAAGSYDGSIRIWEQI